MLDRMGQSEEAARRRKQSALVRTGEPLNRVVAIVDGRQYELDEVQAIGRANVQFVFARNRITLRPAETLNRRGEQLAEASRFDEALEAFRAAAVADPYDPQSRYLEGLTLLLLRRYGEAVDSYRATEALAPGWFQCRADLRLAEQLVSGAVDHDAFLGIHMLQDGPEPPDQKLQVADTLLNRFPLLPLLHLLRGANLTRLGRVSEASAAHRKGLACEPDVDVRTRLLVALGGQLEASEERLALFREAAALSGNLVSAAMATLICARRRDGGVSGGLREGDDRLSAGASGPFLW